MFRTKTIILAALVTTMAWQQGRAAELWRSTFDVEGGFDGMTEFQDGNPGKAMLDPSGAAGGSLPVQLEDGITFGGQHDKGGRLLGGEVNPFATSFSGYYKFAWSQLAETSAEVYTAAGFLGDSQVHISREFIGTVMRHKKEGSDYQVNIGGYFGGVGIGYSGYKAGSFVNLGPAALGTTYQLVVGFDAPTHVLHIAMYDGSGNLLADNVGDLDSGSDYPNLHILSQAVLDSDLNATRLKYLGWQDYIGSANLQTIVWDVDTVAYFDDANEAFTAVESVGSSTGACCQTGGACADGETALDCAAVGGTYQGDGSTCAMVSCPPPPTSACCLPDDTCSGALGQAACEDAGGAWRGPCATCDTTTCDADGQMWKQTFDADRGCLVDIYDQVTAKRMIGPASNGRVQITTWDNTTNQFTPDKAGAPIGTTLHSTDSFSALYEFNWASLNTAEAAAYEGIGFLGSSQPYQTRVICGATLRHWKVEADYYVALDVALGTFGYSDFLRQAGDSIHLGTNPFGQDFSIAIGFCAPSKTLRVALYDLSGELLTLNEADVTQIPSGAGNQQNELNALAVDFIGWEDYTANGGDVATVWQVDSLSYFNTAIGAFNAVEGATPLPVTGACCLPDATCLDVADEAACTLAGGIFHGVCTTCATTACPLVCSLPFADADEDGDVDSDDFAAFQRCFTGPAGSVSTDCRCFDRPENDSPDGDVDVNDYLKFRACQSGATVPADPQCETN